MPNTVSWYVHHAPQWFHKLGVVVNHVVEVAVPLLYVAPQPVAALAGVVTIGFQLWLILTGNFSWLNWLTAVLAVATFSDSTLAGLTSILHETSLGALLPPGVAPGAPPLPAAPLALWALVGLLVAVVAVLSYWPARNLVSDAQAMNASFDPLHLVNTYGAFGSITRTRREVVIEGTDDEPGPDADWREYEFHGKPGDPGERPPQVAPYHHRLGWQLWFAAMSGPRRHPWIGRLVEKLLAGDEGTERLLERDPFPEEPPRYVRASLYRYRFTTPEERRETGDWWHRERVDTYYGPVGTDRGRAGDAAGHRVGRRVG